MATVDGHREARRRGFWLLMVVLLAVILILVGGLLYLSRHPPAYRTYILESTPEAVYTPLWTPRL